MPTHRSGGVRALAKLLPLPFECSLHARSRRGSSQRTLYNYEQSPKAKPIGDITQASLARAFQGKQRHSAFIFRHKNHVIVVLSGKNTSAFEVQPLPISTGAKVRVTRLERTLIDVTGRPTFIILAVCELEPDAEPVPHQIGAVLCKSNRVNLTRKQL